MFTNRTLVIATKHEKEVVLAPVLTQKLGVNCIVPKELDTDQLGTFSGEIERTQSAYLTAKQKCIMAMETTGLDLSIASEGSFGPSPFYGMGYINDELLLFYDKKNELEIAVRDVTYETNFNAKKIKTWEELMDFALQAQFPSHALILKDQEEKPTQIVKAITTKTELKKVFKALIQTKNQLYVETDMRAHLNPTRMKHIAQTVEQLVEKILSNCPTCQRPGFGIEKAEKGLPCAWCNTPTATTLKYIKICSGCGYEQELLYPNGKKAEDPMYCQICNP